MSDHADTIRRARSAAEYEFGNLNQDQKNLLMALADLGESALAENQRLRHALADLAIHNGIDEPTYRHPYLKAEAALAAVRVEDER